MTFLLLCNKITVYVEKSVKSQVKTLMKLGNNGIRDGNFTIPEGVRAVSAFACEHCTRLTSLRVPGGVSQLFHHSFLGCTSLEAVRFQSATTNVSENAFLECNALSRIEIANYSIGLKKNEQFKDLLIREQKVYMHTFCADQLKSYFRVFDLSHEEITQIGFWEDELEETFGKSKVSALERVAVMYDAFCFMKMNELESAEL